MTIQWRGARFSWSGASCKRRLVVCYHLLLETSMPKCDLIKAVEKAAFEYLFRALIHRIDTQFIQNGGITASNVDAAATLTREVFEKFRQPDLTRKAAVLKCVGSLCCCALCVQYARLPTKRRGSRLYSLVESHVLGENRMQAPAACGTP